MKRQQRFDFGSIRSKPVKTSQGFLKLTGNLTRTGVLTYRRSDGTEFRELRLPEEVFRNDSLASLAGAPVTDLHPSVGLVNPANVTKHQKGFVGESVKRDGRFVSAPIVVQDAALIAAVESGERRELSPGYTCEVESNPGTWEGEHYDGIQRSIVYNHLAIGPEGWGRSGSDVALKFDGDANAPPLLTARQVRADGTMLADFVKDALSLKQLSMRDLAKGTGQDEFMLSALLDGFSGGPITEKDLAGVAAFLDEPSRKLFDLVPVANRGDGRQHTRRETIMETVTIHIDGITYQVAAPVGPHIEKALASRDTRITELTAKADAAEAAKDAAVKEAAETKTKLDAAEDPIRLAEAVKARVELETKATAVLGTEVKHDGVADRDIKIRCIKHTDSDFVEEGRSDEYLDARFDLIKPDEKAPAKKRQDATVHALESARNGAKGDEVDRFDAGAARERMYERNQAAWQTPLAASQDSK